jgi:hypothetical protein
MSKNKAGLLLIAIGLLLPLASFKFCSGFDPQAKLWRNIKKMELVIASGKLKSDPSRGTMHYKYFVPYRHILIVATVLVVWGAGKIIFTRD